MTFQELHNYLEWVRPCTPTEFTVVFRADHGDLRAYSRGFGTGILDCLTAKQCAMMTGYDRFMLVWALVAKQLRLARDLRAFEARP